MASYSELESLNVNHSFEINGDQLTFVNDIGDDYKDIIDAINRSNIRVLEATDCTIQDYKFVYLINMLKHNTNIKELYLFETNRGDNYNRDIFDLFMDMLVINTSIVSLAYTRAHFNNEDSSEADALANMIKNNSTLTSLSLMDDNIDFNGLIKISDALKYNHTLVSLDLTRNFDVFYNPEQDKAPFANILENNDTLTSLSLGHNNISKHDFMKMAEALRENHTLRSLDLAYSIPDIGINEMEYFNQMLQDNNTLTYISIGPDRDYDAEVPVHLIPIAIRYNELLESIVQIAKNNKLKLRFLITRLLNGIAY